MLCGASRARLWGLGLILLRGRTITHVQEMVDLDDLSGSGVAVGLEVARHSLRLAHPSAQSSVQDACLEH